MRKLAVVAVAAGLAVGCAHQNSPKPVTQAAPEMKSMTEDGRPVIVHIASRHSNVTISASERGPLYSVKTDEGKLLVANATLEELKRDHADVYRQIAPAIAKGEATADSAQR
jgi:hypothetical protein